MRGASLEDTSMDGTILTDANLAGAYFSRSLLDAADLRGANFEE